MADPTEPWTPPAALCPNGMHITPPSGGQCRCGVVTAGPAADEWRGVVVPVRGNCPMGCGDTLFLAPGGHITCSWIDCPQPDAVATLLDDKECDHVVILSGSTFTVRHPLRERLHDELLTCNVPAYIRATSPPPRAVGRYRLVADGDGYLWWAL